MEEIKNNGREYYTIDVIHILRSLWRRVWLIMLAGILAALLGFSFSSFAIEPEYSSTIMLYVNNSSFSLGNTSFSISSSEITAAQSLVKTYGEILNNRTTLEKIVKRTELPYTYKDLSSMIASSSSNETEIMRVTVTCHNPHHAAKIANCIAEVLPIRISEIIDGASMEVVDSAIPELQKVSPSITKYTVIGFLLGTIFSTLFVAVKAMLDDAIYDEDYVLQTYDYPILAKIPNLLGVNTKRYGYYYRKRAKSTYETRKAGE